MVVRIERYTDGYWAARWIGARRLPLPATLAFDCPTIDALATFLLSVLGCDEAAVAAPSVGPGAANGALDGGDIAAVETLSEEDVKALLAGELAALALDGIGEEKA